MTTYLLTDARDNTLSRHTNTDGAKLSAMFHVNNGDKVEWEVERDTPLQVAAFTGYVGSEKKFVVKLYE